MADETLITVIGRLTADPELRFTPQGAAVANFSVATNPRHYDKQSGEWVGGDATFWDCSVWREQAENVAATLRKGSRVVVTGAVKVVSYTTRSGEQRQKPTIDVREVGPSLRFVSATLNESAGRQSNDQPSDSGSGLGGDDPWASSGGY